MGEASFDGRLPLVAITLGDAAGIGPEVVAKALGRREVRAQCRPLVVGDARILRALAPAASVQAVRRVEDARFEDGTVTVLDLHTLDPAEVRMGEVDASTGAAAVAYVMEAARLAMAGAVDALATAPLNKAAMQQAGYDYIGHTELLADVTGAAHCTTMLATPGLRVTHVTRHVPFREIARHITRANVLRTIEVTHRGMRDLGFTAPRLAVAALNPHNGEDGLLGREEIDAIGPAVRAAQAQGIDAHGPLPADSVFFQAVRGDYDVVVTMYHDQGHIAVKTHGFEHSITITLGLPIVRTSADHGTAFDIAGQGVADATSMGEAILAAAHIARRRASGAGGT
jgi:4-hydroxythreonine-4-phosphate dehydrogenase